MTAASGSDDFAHWLAKWQLEPDGPPIVTDSSRLLPVIAGARLAMLKVSRIEEERRGSRQLASWQGKGAAEVFAIDDEALLLARATGGTCRALVDEGRDDEATLIICRLAGRLHAQAGPPADFLVPLENWFEPLLRVRVGSGLDRAAAIAERLVASEPDPVSLHGDLHHGNVLNFGDGDWRVIDPKGLAGDRAFDFVHLLRNPDMGAACDLLEQRTELVSRAAHIQARRLAEWLAAFSGLSAVWALADGEDSGPDLTLMRRAFRLLD